MARPRKQTYTLDMYLKKNRKGDIDNNADVQRNFVWNNEQINELIVTVLTDDYIPPIILGEGSDSRLHIVDGGQRTAALIKFKYGNHKVTSSIENSMILYKKKAIDKNGNIVYEDAVFNIKNKTFDKLPEELKEKFDEYQIETVIHESCDSSIISRYIKRYNNHVAMNTDQKAFTYIDKFAGRIREILDGRFFVECNNYSEKDKTKGVGERIVVEAMMCMNHFDNWKTQAKTACKYLNDHATEKEFDMFAENLHRLEKIITEDIRDIFNKKDSFIFLTLFDRFTKLKIEDIKFSCFLREFKTNLRKQSKNEKGLLFDEIDKDAGTKDKQVVSGKLDMLENLMLDFLHINEAVKTESAAAQDYTKSEENVAFIADVLNADIKEILEDMEIYSDTLDDLIFNTVKDGSNSKLVDSANRKSLLAMIAYSYKNEVDLDNWFAEYVKKNNMYFSDQRKNFLHMKNDFEKYLIKCA